MTENGMVIVSVANGIDKARFGSIANVMTRLLHQTSYHVDVREPINVFDKFSFEADFEDKSTGGCISYAEIPICLIISRPS